MDSQILLRLSKPTLRLAEPRDLEAVAQLEVKLRDETHWKDVDFVPDPEAIALWLLAVLSTSPQQVLYVAEREERIIGFCLGLLTVHPSVPSVPIICEQGWYVVPEHRHGTVGWDLWELVVVWGIEHGAKAASYSKPFYTKPNGHGYHAIECVYWRDMEESHG